MSNREFYSKNGISYENPKTHTTSLYNITRDKGEICRNSIAKKIMSKRRHSERNYVRCSISMTSLELFVDYPIVDGILVYMTKKPSLQLKRGIDYQLVVIKRVKYYVFPISFDALSVTLKEERGVLEEKFIPGRVYSRSYFLKRLGMKKNRVKLGTFILHSQSLYHNGSRITNFISKYNNIRNSVEEWDDSVEVPKEEPVEQKRSWWSFW